MDEILQSSVRRIFCGVQATGRGHLSRFTVVKNILEDRGHEVYGYASGQEIPPYTSGIDRFDLGPTFFIRDNRIDALASARYNALKLALFLRNYSQLKKFLRDKIFDHAIVDFEPNSARALVSTGTKFTIFDNQTFALLPHENLKDAKCEIANMRRFVKFYYGKALARADTILTYSLVPAKPAYPNQIIVPPCVRIEVRELVPARENHLLYYSSIGTIPVPLIEFARRNPTKEIRAYVAQKPAPGTVPPNIRIPDRNASTFLTDLASCCLYITGAGFESVAEAVTLKKPLLVIPIKGQWEQCINAEVIRENHIGETASLLSSKLIEQSLEKEQLPSPEIQEWIAGGRAVLTEALVAPYR